MSDQEFIEYLKINLIALKRENAAKVVFLEALLKDFNAGSSVESLKKRAYKGGCKILGYDNGFSKLEEEVLTTFTTLF
jgi:hypothetical protein